MCLAQVVFQFFIGGGHNGRGKSAAEINGRAISFLAINRSQYALSMGHSSHHFT
jgi:hypothetical protein